MLKNQYKNSSFQAEYKLFFATLANKTRFKIVHILLNGPRSVTEIQQELQCDQSMISHNLKRLEQCSFVSVQRKGKQRIYSLNKETIDPLLKLMDRHVKKFCKNFCNKK